MKQSKITSHDIQSRLQRNEITERDLNLARQKYSAIATRATILFFTVQNLSLLNIMYQFSLSWFYNIFQSCLGINNSNTSTKSIANRNIIYEDTTEEETVQVSNQRRPSIINVEEILNVHNSRRRRSSITAFSGSLQNSLAPGITNLNDSLKAGANFKTENEFNEYIQSIMDNLTHTVYQVVSWALFAKHKLIFSFSLCLNILKHHKNESNQRITRRGLGFFLNSSVLADLQQDILTEKIKNITNLNLFGQTLLIEEKKLRQVLLLEDLLPEKFKDLSVNMQSNCEEFWLKFMNHKDPYNFISEEESSEYFKFSDLTDFQKLILVKLLRPDALIQSIDHFITNVLGAKFLVTSVPTLNKLYAQSSANTPIIFILSPGSDPTNQLLRFAKDFRGNTLHLEIVSLGQGQGPKSEELISKSLMLKGRWVFLQNCHLAASFMPRLQQIVNKFVTFFIFK